MHWQSVASYVALALTHLQWGNRKEAQRMVSLGLAAQQVDGERVPLIALRILQTRLLLATRQQERARASAAASHAAAGNRQPPHLISQWLTLIDAELELRAGNPASALGVLGSLEGTSSWGEGRLLAAQAHLELDESARAEDLLASVRDATPDSLGAGLGAVVEAWVLTALVADRHRAEHDAVAALTRALSLAEPEGIRQPFFTLGEARLPVLLRRQQQFAPHPTPFASQLVADLASSASSPGPPLLTQPLTHRELTVLAELATMASNAEIAAGMFVSVNTVKAHARGVYRKLEVPNRRQAVLRARELGLL